MLLLIMVLYIATFPYLRTTKKSLTSLLLVASSTSWLRVCFESAMCLLRLGPKETPIKHISERYLKNFSTNPISTRVFSQKTKRERSKIQIAECLDQSCRLYEFYFGLAVIATSRWHKEQHVS